MKTRYFSLIVVLFLSTILTVAAQDKKPYPVIANERASKIVKGLALSDVAKEKKVTKIIADQYIALDKIQNTSETKIKKNSTKKEQINKKADLKIAKLHRDYLTKLAVELDKEQVDEVKNGMTYHTVIITYANYLLMLPYSTKEEQEKILAWLIEAREHAMDAGTAKGKHAWFNKYKGKIAIYLDARGYNLKKEGTLWADRRNTKASTLEITASNRIMDALKLTDKTKAESVRNLIAYQYQKLEELKNSMDKKIEENKTLPNKDQIAAENEVAWQVYKSSVDRQRDMYFAALSGFINANQIELIKNEMTDHRLDHEFSKFLRLLPNMEDEQKAEVYKYLVEGRENALNVLTSREKNQWFAKYRGRANIYLSKQGYDLKKATEDLKAAESQN